MITQLSTMQPATTRRSRTSPSSSASVPIRQRLGLVHILAATVVLQGLVIVFLERNAPSKDEGPGAMVDSLLLQPVGSDGNRVGDLKGVASAAGKGTEGADRHAAKDADRRGDDEVVQPLAPLTRPLRRMPVNVYQAIDMLLMDHREHNFDDVADTIGHDDPRPNPAFVQIGAGDGKMYDPLHKPMQKRHQFWNGLLVEPQPKLYQQLVSLHGDKADHWGFYNGLVSPSCGIFGTMEFCESVASGGEGGNKTTFDWREQGHGNSVSMQDCIDSDRGKKGPRYVRARRPCVKDVKELIEKHSPVNSADGGGGSYKVIQPDRIDLLQIDTEGHDFEIIKGVFDAEMRPRCIHYEASLRGVKQDSMLYLQSRGYTVRQSTRDDYLACRVDANQNKGGGF